MTSVTANRFSEFYSAVHGYGPFPWQRRVAARACDSSRHWPRAIALPTAAGKTACIDLAVFALACQAELGEKRTAARRIFFVVDRRIVVDQAYQCAEKLAKALAGAKAGILLDVADALRKLADDERPLDVYALRGGMYRETAWVRSPLQPTVITSTVDQVGSRLLFRGYGVSDSMKPIHAGLVGNDALILLDEAHCARAFDQTAHSVEMYRQWGSDGRPPFRFVSITATPSGELSDNEIERDEEDDRKHDVLGQRIDASKPATLVVAKKGTGEKWQDELIKELSSQARGLVGVELGTDLNGKSHFVKAVGVIVNRVATARKLAASLQSDDVDVILLTGRMRPVDRDVILTRLEPLYSGSKRQLERTTIVVATQCLEVGADLDFHGIVTESASLDALRQRFGRLNRIAARPSAKGVIVIRADQTEDSRDDRVYGASLSRTWNWLKSKANDGVFDFGVAAVREATYGEDLTTLNAPVLDAPVLFPVHLDCWVQTHPMPIPDPDPALFLHGPKSGIPDVQVVFRTDLGDDSSKWAEIVSLCPPSSSEAVPVRIDVFRRWLTEPTVVDESGDVEGESGRNDGELQITSRTVFRWRGPRKSKTITSRDAIWPGDTIVVPDTESHLESLGDFPSLPPSDRGDEAFQRSRDKAILRLTNLDLDEEDQEFDENLTNAITARLTEDSPAWLKRAVEDLSDLKRRTVARHPLGGWVVMAKWRLHQFDPTFLEDDESSESPAHRAVTLDEHSRGVASFARRFATGCGLDADLYATAGFFHDSGKLDPRFQALLKGGSPRTSAGVALAKSGTFGAGDRSVHCYPAGGRHELLSTALLAAKTNDDLLLHLIATHHGSARPFSGFVEENGAAKAPFTTMLFGQPFSLESCAQVPALWNRELAHRFWRIVRRFGWWKVAYHEAVFRLADHAQSRAEQEEEDGKLEAPTVLPLPLSVTPPKPLQPIELTGLDGSNPLAFLAALGALRLADQAFKGSAKLSWVRKGQWTPVLHAPGDTNPEELVEHLHRLVHRVGNPDAANRAATLDKDYRRKRKAVQQALKSIKDRRIRGKEREAAITNEVAPLEAIASSARGEWLRALETAVPAPFLTLGKALSVTVDEFRVFALRAVERLRAFGPDERAEADFASSFGSEVFATDPGRIVPTEFQLITGSGHQFFLETIGTLMESASTDRVRRALFAPWAYKDQRLSLRWDPIDDRRYAQRWADPSDDVVVSEHGANLLAAFALPLFPVIPTVRGPITTGFNSLVEVPVLTWPIWTAPQTVDVVRSLLAFDQLQQSKPNRRELLSVGIADAFSVRKIQVGSGLNTKLNLTPAVPV